MRMTLAQTVKQTNKLWSLAISRDNASPTNNNNHGQLSIKNSDSHNKKHFWPLRIVVFPHQKVLVNFGKGNHPVATPALSDFSVRDVLSTCLSCLSPKRQHGCLPAISHAPSSLQWPEDSAPTPFAPPTQGHIEEIFGATWRCGQRWGIKPQSKKCRRRGYIRPLRMREGDLDAEERQGGCGVWPPLSFPSWRKAEQHPVPIGTGSTSLPGPGSTFLASHWKTHFYPSVGPEVACLSSPYLIIRWRAFSPSEGYWCWKSCHASQEGNLNSASFPIWVVSISANLAVPETRMRDTASLLQLCFSQWKFHIKRDHFPVYK